MDSKVLGQYQLFDKQNTTSYSLIFAESNLDNQIKKTYYIGK
jgi:hypothetical protein